MATKQEALDLIDGEIIDGMVIYHADETSSYWTCDESKLDELAELMSHENDDIRRDAYSHWCAGCDATEYADRIDEDDLLGMDWRMMPVDGGQIIETKYAVADGYLYRKSLDRSDMSLTCERALLDDDDSDFEPYNGSLPNHGRWKSLFVDRDCEPMK